MESLIKNDIEPILGIMLCNLVKIDNKSHYSIKPDPKFKGVENQEQPFILEGSSG